MNAIRRVSFCQHFGNGCKNIVAIFGAPLIAGDQFPEETYKIVASW